MRLYFAKPLPDMTAFEALRDNEARTPEQETEFNSLFATLETNEARIATDIANLRSLTPDSTYHVVTNEDGCVAIRAMIDGGESVEWTTIVNELGGDDLHTFYSVEAPTIIARYRELAANEARTEEEELELSELLANYESLNTL